MRLGTGRGSIEDVAGEAAGDVPGTTAEPLGDPAGDGTGEAWGDVGEGGVGRGLAPALAVADERDAAVCEGTGLAAAVAPPARPLGLPPATAEALGNAEPDGASCDGAARSGERASQSTMAAADRSRQGHGSTKAPSRWGSTGCHLAAR